MSTIHIVMILVLVFGVVVFMNALLRGGRMVGGFMDKAEKAKAARLQRGRAAAQDEAAEP